MQTRLGFPAVDKLLPAVKREAARLGVDATTRAQVAAAARESNVAQVFAPPRPIKGAIWGMAPGEHWQVDINVLTSLGAAQGNKGWQNVLFVVDVFTRRAYGARMKNRDDETVRDAFRQFFQDAGSARKMLSADDDSGFQGPLVRDLIADRGTLHRVKDPSSKNEIGVADAGVLTFKRVLVRQLTEANTAIWYTRVPSVIDALNCRLATTYCLCPSQKRVCAENANVCVRGEGL